MVFSAKSSTNNEGWGMGFLLILFHHHSDYNYFLKKKPSSFSLPSSISNTKFTLSICAFLVFTTLLLFTLSTFEPTSILHYHPPRRFLQQTKTPKSSQKIFSFSTFFSPHSKGSESNFTRIAASALQGMGTLFLRGTKAMSDLIVAHVDEHVSEIELRTFLRVIYFSGILSRSDFVLIFPSPLLASRFRPVVKSECDSFLRIVRLGRELGRLTGFGHEFNRYWRKVGKGEKEPIWERKGANSNSSELTRSSYGSVVGFDASELDPEESLSGFLDHVPMSLRRWACYPMLLGRVRRQFKHMMLVDVKSLLILSDPFNRVRNQNSESLLLWSNRNSESTRHHGKRNSSKARDSDPKTQVHAGIIVGGSRGVRRFAAAALTEIVRNVIEHKGKGRKSITVTESGLVNQLVHSEHLLKNINMITPTESIPELNSLNGFKSGNSSWSLVRVLDHLKVVQNGGRSSGVSVDINNLMMRVICASHRLSSSVYKDCLSI